MSAEVVSVRLHLPGVRVSTWWSTRLQKWWDGWSPVTVHHRPQGTGTGDQLGLKSSRFVSVIRPVPSAFTRNIPPR